MNTLGWFEFVRIRGRDPRGEHVARINMLWLFLILLIPIKLCDFMAIYGA